MDAYLLRGDSEGEEYEVLIYARFQCLISSSHLQRLAPRHRYCWTLEMVIQTADLQLKRKCLYFTFSFDIL